MLARTLLGASTELQLTNDRNIEVTRSAAGTEGAFLHYPSGFRVDLIEPARRASKVDGVSCEQRRATSRTYLVGVVHETRIQRIQRG